MTQSEVLQPECYQAFSCKGGACRFSCCNGWSIRLSKEEYKKICQKDKTVQKCFGLPKKGKKEIKGGYEVVPDANGDCPLLTAEHLCKLQLQHGEGILPSVCRSYPRTYHRYLDKLERGMDLGCEKVLEILYEEKEGLVFANNREQIPALQRLASSIDEKSCLKYPAHIYYYDIQSLCLGILQAEGAEIEERLIVLGMALSHIDELVKEKREQEIPEYIQWFTDEVDNLDTVDTLEQVNGEHLSALYYNLDMIQRFAEEASQQYSDFANLIVEKLQLKTVFTVTEGNEETVTKQLNFSIGIYKQCQQNFKEFIKGKEFFLENIMVGFMMFYNMPFHNPENGVWKDYMYFMWTYSMLKFALTVTLNENSTVEDMIDCCVIMFRKIGHS